MIRNRLNSAIDLAPRRSRRLHIVFAGGGTAGHLFPGLAVADWLRQHHPRARMTFVGTGRQFEQEHVIDNGYHYLALPCRPLPKHPGEALRFVTDNMSGFWSARRFLREEEAAIVVGLGGYASAPALRAAVSLKLPFVLLEQNAVPGRTTRWLARRANLVCGAFAQVRSRLHADVRLEITGTPVRQGFAALATKSPNSAEGPRLLVLGGSGGAQILNEQVPLAIYKAGETLAGWDIMHQCGRRDVDGTTELYKKLGLTARVTPFIRNMPAVLARTQLAISRSGGTTLAELAAAGVPSILLPYPRATDDHQRQNAEVFLAAGACRLIDERTVEGRLDNNLAAELRTLAADANLRQRMSTAAGQLAKVEAAGTVGRAVLELAQSTPPATKSVLQAT
jgi:UDP-N-acetylglucosamine--N-acetylmuramyl-(pentapeptide) pyrophosphoryl-undecaprenol N-acetylglucosamine transferase